MSRIDDLIAEHCPDGVEYRQLGDIGKFIRGNGLQKKDLKEFGLPAIHYGQIHTRYDLYTAETCSFVSESVYNKLRKAAYGDIIFVTTSEDDGAVAKAIAWLGSQEVGISGDSVIFKHDQNPKYLSYLFQSNLFHDQKKGKITGTKVRRVSPKDLSKIKLPFPPVSIQEEIVRVLDKFTQLEAELEAELEARRRQYQHYRDELLTFTKRGGVRLLAISEICGRIVSGGTPRAGASEYYEGGTIPWLRTQEVKFTDIHETEVKITEKALSETSAKWVKENSVIIAISGATAGRSAVNKIPLTTNQHCCCLEIDEDIADYRYVFHWVSRNYELIKSLGRGARSDLNVGIIKSIKMPIPSLDEQKRIAQRLDAFDALVNSISSGLPAEIKARRKQYEYYRDELLTFKEKA